METIIVSIITGGLSLLGVIITNKSSNDKISVDIQRNQAVTDTKIEELTREVREHNNFARRVPVLEEKVDNLTSRISKLEER